MKAAKRKVLIVDDDAQVVYAIRAYLEKEGYEVASAADGMAALKAAQSLSPDLIVLDINFPDSKIARMRSIDGIEVLRRLRDTGNIPILMLSTTSIPSVKVMALSIGADDFLSKPFEIQELGARIAAILRRGVVQSPDDRVLSFHRLRLDPGARRVFKDDQAVELTGTEFDILHALARRPNHVFSREFLLEHAWNDGTCCIPKVVDVHIGHIRRKIEDDPRHPVFIVTVRGAGYRFEGEPISP